MIEQSISASATVLHQEVPLLAADRIREISRGFQNALGQETVTIILVSGLAGLVLLWVLYRWMKPVIDRRREVSRMFNQLSSLHNLNSTQKRMLNRIAGRRDLDNPCVLFVRPDYLLGDAEENQQALRQLAEQIYGSGVLEERE